MGTKTTRREAMKTALKAGAYVAPALLSVSVAQGVAASSPLPPPASADLTLSIYVQHFPGSTGVFIVNADNLGPTPASNGVVTITHAATLTLGAFGVTQGTIDPTTGIWSVGTIPVNPLQAPLLTVNYAGTGNVTTTITSSTPDPNPANNTFSTPVT